MKVLTAASIWLIIAFSVVTMWDQSHWMVSIPEIGVFALATLLLAACAAGRQRLELSQLMAPLALVVVWGLLQMWLGESVYPWRTKVSVVYWAANAATFFAALQAFGDTRIRRGFLDAMLVFAFAIAIIGAIQGLDPGGKVFWIFTPDPKFIPQFGPFPYRNQYAAFVELLLPFALFRAITDERRGIAFGVVAAVLYTSVIAAGSRMGALLATAEMLIVPVLVMWQRRIPFRRIRSAGLFFLTILIMLGIAAGPATLVRKFSVSDPYAGRREYSEASIEMIKDRPLFGFGLGTWSTVYPSYARSDDGLFINQAHNDWAQWTAEGGLLFFALMLSIAVQATRRAIRTGWGLGVTAVFIHCLVDYPIQRTGVALTMFAMLAAVASEHGSRAETSSSARASGSFPRQNADSLR